MKTQKDRNFSEIYKILVSGLIASLALFALLSMEYVLKQPLLMAPFGASCVLLFLLPGFQLA